jgi:hypothetical protein
MIYELALRIFGAGIAGIIQFLPLSVDYRAADPSLTVAATLTAPVTKEARRLVETGMSLRISYDWSLIVNDTRAYHKTTKHALQWKKNVWLIDNDTLTAPFDTIQARTGHSVARFPGFRFDEGDHLLLLVKATLLPDSAFTAATRMRTDVLWNCRIPTRKECLVFTHGKFERE